MVALKKNTAYNNTLQTRKADAVHDSTEDYVCTRCTYVTTEKDDIQVQGAGGDDEIVGAGGSGWWR
jgi:hypothetical protein